jgi:hypothetical protein
MLSIVHQRLHNQHLSSNPFQKTEDVVSHLGAVQAQDFYMSKWALGMRMLGATDSRVETDFNDGKILRTHMLRPTWHFVTPEDIGWVLKLTSPRVQFQNAHMYRREELDEKILSKAHKVLVLALQGNNFLTRAELSTQLGKASLLATGQRLGYILMHAELSGLICSGPRREKQFTYALMEERVTSVKKIEGEKALAELTLRYFTSHGPAQVRDFVWWSSLSKNQALVGLDLVKDKLVQEVIDEKTYWSSPDSKPKELESPKAFFMSIYDEYTIAYNDRSALGVQMTAEKLLSMGNALTSVLIVDGLIVGTWKRIFTKKGVEVTVSPFRKLNQNEKVVVKEEAERFGKFLEMPVEIK